MTTTADAVTSDAVTPDAVTSSYSLPDGVSIASITQDDDAIRVIVTGDSRQGLESSEVHDYLRAHVMAKFGMRRLGMEPGFPHTKAASSGFAAEYQFNGIQ